MKWINILLILLLVPSVSATFVDYLDINITDSSMTINDSYGNYAFVSNSSANLSQRYVLLIDEDCRQPDINFPASQCNPSFVCAPNLSTSFSCPACPLEQKETELKCLDIVDKQLNPQQNVTIIETSSDFWDNTWFPYLAIIILGFLAVWVFKPEWLGFEEKKKVDYKQQALEQNEQELRVIKDKMADMENEKKKREIEEDNLRIEREKLMNEVREQQRKIEEIKDKTAKVVRESNGHKIEQDEKEISKEREAEIDKKINEAMRKAR